MPRLSSSKKEGEFVEMAILFASYAVFGSLSIWLITKGLYMLTSNILIYMRGNKTHGKVSGYEEKSYWIKSRGYNKKETVFYPKIEYFAEADRYETVVKTVLNLKNKKYRVNETVDVYYNKCNPRQVLIKKDVNCFNDAAVMSIGFIYLAVVVFLAKMVVNWLPMIQVTSGFAVLVTVLSGVVLRLFINILHGFIDREKIKNYYVQMLICYMLLITGWFVYWIL